MEPESPLPSVAPGRYTSSLQIEKVAPETVEENETFTYEVRLTNASKTPVDVTLSESLLSVFTIESFSPEALSSETHAARWMLGPIYPGHSETIRIRCRSKKRMHFRSHTTVAFAQES